VNILGNKFIQAFSFFVAFIKIGGLALLAAGGLWASGLNVDEFSVSLSSCSELLMSGIISVVISTPIPIS